MGNLHSYYGDVSSSSPSSLSPSDHSWHHRLDQHTLRSLFINHQSRVVSLIHPADIKSSLSTSSPSPPPSLDLFFADLPPSAYSHGVHRDILSLLSYSSPFLSPHSPPFLHLLSFSTTRLSRQLHELLYHHVNHTLMHSITSNEQLSHIQSQQRHSSHSFAYSLLLPSSPDDREDHSSHAKSHLKHILAKTQGKAGRKLLTPSILEVIEKAGGVGSLYNVDPQPLRDLSRDLQAASHEQLMKDELTCLIRMCLSLGAHTMSASQMLQTLQCLVGALRMYGDMRLPMFSSLTRFNHEMLPIMLVMCRDEGWKSAVVERMQDAFAFLGSNDREKQKEGDKEKEGVSFSYAIAFILLHLSILGETHNRHHLQSMESVTGQCTPVPHYSPFTVPFVLDFSPESLVTQIDLLSTLTHLRPDTSLPASYKQMYQNIRSLFPPFSPRHSLQTVRLLLPLLSSLLASPSSLMCRQFKYGADGPFFECIEEYQERKDILLMIGFRIVERKRGKGEESKERSPQQSSGGELDWYVEEQQIDLPLLRYTVQQLTRLNHQHYEQHTANSPLNSLSSSSPLSTSILSLLSLLRTFLLTAKTNRVTSSLLTRPDLLSSQKQPPTTTLIDVLIALTGRDETEWLANDADRRLEREKACDLMCLAFPLLSSSQQLRVLHHSLLSTALRQSLLQLLTVEPMAFCFFPSQHTPSSSASLQTVWERVCKGVSKEKSMAGVLQEADVVSFLIEHHDQGTFSLQGVQEKGIKGRLKHLCDWLGKTSATSGGDEVGAGGNGEISSSPPPAASPTVKTSEEKKEMIGEASSPNPLISMPSPPLLSYTRSISAFPSIDTIDLNEFHSLLDLFFYYLTSSSTPSATRSELQLMMMHIQRCLLTRTLIPLNSYDRTHTPLLLTSYASSLIYHANDFITTLKHRHSAPASNPTAPLTSLTPSFPPVLSLPPTYQTDLHSSPFAFLLSSLLPPFAFLASLPKLSLPLDEQLLTSLHTLLGNMGGYGGLDDDGGLKEVVEREEKMQGERKEKEAEEPTYTQLQDRLAMSNVLVETCLPSSSTFEAFIEHLTVQGEKGKTLLSAMSRVREERQVHHLTLDSLHLLESYTFPLIERYDEQFTNHQPDSRDSRFRSHVSLPSLHVCVTCGARCSTPLNLLSHPTARSLCSSPSTHFAFLHHSVFWLLAKVSRHMAASCPSNHIPHAAPLRDRVKDAEEKERPLTGVEAIGPSLPRSIDEWLNSELMKSGLEDSVVAAPTASILPPLAVSASSSFAPSLNVSLPSTPKSRSIPLTAMQPMGPSSILFSGEMTLPPSTSFGSSQQLGPSTLPSEFNKTSPTSHSSSSSSVSLPPSLELYEKTEKDKFPFDDLTNKGSVTIESPRGSVTMSLNLSSPHDDHNQEKLKVYGDKRDAVHRRLELVTTEPYENAHYLQDLIYGDNEAGELDAAVMRSSQMMMYATKRKMVGKKAVEASRAIIACLLKHTNKVELALDDWSLFQDDSSHQWSPSLLRAWKLGSEVLTDMIAAHQQGMQYLCAAKGCECETAETHDREGKEKFRCTAGHLQDRCIEKDTAPYEFMAERVMKNCKFLLQLRPSLASSASLQMQRLNSMRVRKILKVRPPLPNPSPEPSPLYDTERGEREMRRKGDKIKLKPQPQLTWSTTSAALHELMVPHVPLSPLSAPLPSKKKTLDEGDGEFTPPESNTPEQQQRVIRRGSMGMIPAQIDVSLVRITSGGKQKREKLKAAVKRELQAQKWKELRDELLLSRNSFVSLLSRIPLSNLVLSFAKDFSPVTSHLIENLDLALRSAVMRAERRVKGLESLCLIIKNGGMGAKMLGLAELNVVVKEWTIEKGGEKKSATVKDKTAEVSSTSFFPSSTSSPSSSAVSPMPLQPLTVQRYDNDLLTCGAARLSMISDAFYVLSGVIVNLMRQCMNVLLTQAIAGGAPPPPILAPSNISLEVMRSEQASAEVSTGGNQPPPFTSQRSSSLTSSTSLALLLASLSCWQVSYHRSDFTFLRNTGVLSVIDILIQSYPSLPLSPGSISPLSLDSLDLTRVKEIGKKSRSVFRLLVLSCLTADQVQLKGAEEEEEREDSDAGGGEKKENEGGIAVDSFESSLLNTIFARLEGIVSRIHERGRRRQEGKEEEAERQGRAMSSEMNGRSIRSQLSSFTLPPQQQFEQDEMDCAEMLSLLLLSCSSARIRLSLTHSPADSTPASPQLLSPFSSFSLPLSARCLYLLLSLTSSLSFISLSPRCIRHILRICQQLLPLLTPATVDSVFSHQLDSVSDDENQLNHPQQSPFILHLLSSIGYFTCGKFLERPSFFTSATHSQSIASELTALLRLLCCSSSWNSSITLAITSSLRNLQHRQFKVTDDVARLAFYREWGALSVLGGNTEEARVGVRVAVQRVTQRNEKLSKEPIEEDKEKQHATVIGLHHHQLIVIYDYDTQFKQHVVSRTQCTFLPLIPCLHPIHTGKYGPVNLSSVVSYINQAFSSSSSSSVFALYPPSLHAGEADSIDQQLNYVHSLLKVYAVKVLCYAISHSLTMQSPMTVLLQAILRDATSSSATPSSSTLMSNLLSIAQNVIPLTQGVGQLPSLEGKQTALHSLLHDRPLPLTLPTELKQLSIHVDLCHRALSIFGNDLPSAISWLKGKHIAIKLEESQAKRETISEVLRGLQEMGFSTTLCQKALLLCNGDSNQAVNWLMDNGMQAMEDQRNGVNAECWGLEGVDFYQEKGHWIPEHYHDVDGEEYVGMTGEALANPTKHQPKGGQSMMDPYRRLALYTGPRMKAQSELNERFRVEQRGLEGRTAVTSSLDEDDVRIGQLLRVNTAWCISQAEKEAAEEKRQSATVEEYRWFFLTEDNNWAPLDAKDMAKLDAALLADHSATWIGIEEKSPSLIRLDKMCMYNEITGHGRPLKRRRVERTEGSPPSSLSDEPPAPVSLYSQLSVDLQLKATELAGLGFPLNHCARALLETKGNVDAAANWIMNNEQQLEAMDREEAKKREKREQWEAKQKEAANTSASSSTSSSSPSTDVPIKLSSIYPYSGQLGRVQEISASRKQVRLSFIHPNTAHFSTVWLPIEACEWDDSAIIHLLPELNGRRFQGLAGLALDVASSEFILLARRCVLLMLYVLSSDKAGHGKAGRVELIKNLNANVFMRIIKLASADPMGLTLAIHMPHWLSSFVSKASAGEGEEGRSSLLSPSHAIATAAASIVPPLDLWHILHCILHNPISIFASPVRDSLLHLLIDDLRVHLMVASSNVRDVDTEHPYQSSISEKHEIRIDSASHLLVTFDKRCNLNQAHACLAFYSDAECTQELAIFSGSADEFSHIVVPGNHFFYQFTSGGLRVKPYEFGFRFRVRPIGVVHKDENALLQHSLGWPVLTMIADSPQLLDTLLAFHACSDLISAMLRYLTVCRSPCKVMVSRALTALCVRIKQPMPAAMFEILLRVMEQLYESNTASGWGSSPFLMALVDLMRVRPTFKLSDSELWSVDTIDGRPAGWFFLTVLRAESLSRSLFFSSRLPAVKLVERAFHEMSDIEVLRWCLKQPELCLKLHKQTRGWNAYRRDWMTGINGFTQYNQAAEVLIALKQSLLPECYRFTPWVTGTAGKEWEEKVKKSTSAADIARSYMELESALKWGDSYPETERAFGDTWASRRPDWLAAMKGLAAATQVKVITVQEVMDYRWTRAMDEQLVAFIDETANKSARRLMSLTFRDIEPLSKADADNPAYALLRNLPIEVLRARFAILKMISTDYMRVLPIVDLSLRASWSISPLVRHVSKTLIFQQSKMYLWRSMLGRLYSEERPQFVILNRQEAAKKRKDAQSRLQHSLFYQLYSHIGMLVDPSSLRRRGQAWMVKFVGEGGHDVGGLYNESLVDICNELQSEGNPNSPHTQLLPLFRLCPNGRHGVGENRNKYVPTSSSTSPLHLSMFEFIGRLMGIWLVAYNITSYHILYSPPLHNTTADALFLSFFVMYSCLDNNRALPLDLCTMVWKVITSEPLTLADLKSIDYHTWNTINIIRNPAVHKLTEETFDYLFPDLFFTTESTCGVEHELCKGGAKRRVTFQTANEYADLLESDRLNEFNLQIDAICRGLYSIIPYEFLSIFSHQQLEVMITGSPEIDIGLLREKTEYRGNVNAKDRHISLFWETLESFSSEEKTAFVQFVSGRSRLPSSALGFGKDMFKVSDHGQALSATNTINVDHYLPVAHTCFFALELPRYSSKQVMRTKLIYAIRNCVSIDGDATHEGRANMMMTWSDSD